MSFNNNILFSCEFDIRYPKHYITLQICILAKTVIQVFDIISRKIILWLLLVPTTPIHHPTWLGIKYVTKLVCLSLYHLKTDLSRTLSPKKKKVGLKFFYFDFLWFGFINILIFKNYLVCSLCYLSFYCISLCFEFFFWTKSNLT